MAGSMNRAEFPLLMEPTLKKAFFYEYNLGGSQYDKYWDVQDSVKAKEEIAETVIPSTVPAVGEGGMYARGTLSMGRAQLFVHITYKLEIVMTEELAEDNLYPAALSTQKALAVAMKRTVEKLAAQTYSNGLISTFVPDGQLVFSAAHPVLYPQGTNPTSWSNVLSSQAFGSVGTKALKVLMKKMRDENGDLAPHEMNQLLVPPDLEEQALEMKRAPGTFDTANRTYNQAADGLDVMVVDHFVDAAHSYTATAYFGRDKRLAQNIFFWRVKPEYKLLYEEATGNVIQRVRARFSMGFVNARGNVAAWS